MEAVGCELARLAATSSEFPRIGPILRPLISQKFYERYCSSYMTLVLLSSILCIMLVSDLYDIEFNLYKHTKDIGERLHLSDIFLARCD